MEHKYHKSIRGTSAAEIAASVEEAIRSGALGPGARLPTVRGLAQSLGLSPSTVSAAYRTLRGRGLIVAGGRRGSAVSPRPPIAPGALPDATTLPEGVRNLADGNPDRTLLPDLAPALQSIRTDHALYGEPMVEPELAQLALEGLRSDGIPASAVAVVAGALDGLERVLTAQLRPGDRVAVEDPAFVGVLDLLGALGLEAVPVAIDDSGLRPEALDAVLARGVAALIVTPRAQNPTGAALNETRKRQLRPILRRHPDVLLFEDDHAGAVAGAPVVSLVDAKRPCWAVVRSVAKSLGPDLRVATLAADPGTLARVEGRQLLGMRWVSQILQRTVIAQWKDRRVARQLQSAERTYTTRRNALIEALASHGIGAHGRSGLNVWIPVPEEGRLLSALQRRGWALSPGARFRISSPPGVRACVASLDPKDARKLAADLAALLSAKRVSTV